MEDIDRHSPQMPVSIPLGKQILERHGLTSAQKRAYFNSLLSLILHLKTEERFQNINFFPPIKVNTTF